MSEPIRRVGTGLLPGLSFEQYTGLSGVSASALKMVNSKSLAHVKAMRDGLIECDSDALDFGTAFHDLLLRNEQTFTIRPDTYMGAESKKKDAPMVEKEWNANSNTCKAWMAENPNHFSQAEAIKLQAMVNSCRAISDLQPYLNGDCEITAVAEKDGIRRKGLIDLLPKDGPVIDFKSCQSAAPYEFVSAFRKFGYDIQMAFYLDLLADIEDKRRSEFWMVAVETSAPYVSSVYKFKDQPVSVIRAGRIKYRKAMAKLQTAKQSNDWPGYGNCDEPDNYWPGYAKEELGEFQ